MRRLSTLLVLFALALPAGSASVAGDDPAHFAWEAPASTAGPLAVEMVFDLGEPQRCILFIATAGTTRASPVLSWEEVAGSPGPLYSTNNAQVHTGMADSRTVQSVGGAWSMESTYEQTWGGLLPVTVIVPQAGSWQRAGQPYHAPLRIDLSCEREVGVASARAGREAIAFTSDSMKGGTGANLNALIFVEATVTRGDTLTATLASPEVQLRTLSMDFGGQIDGELRLDAPSGAHAWDVKTEGDVRHVDGPGTYALTLDYTAAGLGDTYVGVLSGTAQVASLDAPW